MARRNTRRLSPDDVRVYDGPAKIERGWRSVFVPQENRTYSVRTDNAAFADLDKPSSRRSAAQKALQQFIGERRGVSGSELRRQIKAADKPARQRGRGGRSGRTPALRNNRIRIPNYLSIRSGEYAADVWDRVNPSVELRVWRHIKNLIIQRRLTNFQLVIEGYVVFVRGETPGHNRRRTPRFNQVPSDQLTRRSPEQETEENDDLPRLNVAALPARDAWDTEWWEPDIDDDSRLRRAFGTIADRWASTMALDQTPYSDAIPTSGAITLSGATIHIRQDGDA